jgi:hypothetical protein
MLIIYLLPIGDGRYTLWTDADTRMGEIPNCEAVILSPFNLSKQKLEDIRALVHDNLFRFAGRMMGTKRRFAASFWFRMLWGFLGLLAFQDPLEDLLWGLYLLLGNPMFANAVESIWQNRDRKIQMQFNTLAYCPEIKVVVSPALQELAQIVAEDGFVKALHSLYKLGLPELIGFYKRAAWSERWENVPPTGLGVVYE